MGYDLHAENEGVEPFQFGAFSWGHVVQTWGYLFPFQARDSKFYMVEMDEDREVEVWNQETDDGYIRETTRMPMIDSNDGFVVKADECPVIARMLRNFVRWQTHVNNDPSVAEDVKKHETPEFKRAGLRAWPTPMREDWLEKMWEFADWVERSGGFAIH